MVDNKILLKNAISDIFDGDTVDENVVAKYFSKDYIQYVDGKTLDYQQFIEHLHTQRKTVYNIRFTFEHLVSEGDKVVSIHYPEADKRSGGRIKAKVIALFIIKNNKIILCDELTHLIVGDKEDHDLGSR